MRIARIVSLCVLGLTLFIGQAFAAAPQMDEATHNVLQQAAEAYKAKDYAKTKQLIKPLADKDEPIATFLMGLMAARGEGETASPQTAATWWQKSADKGFPDAQFNLGFLHFAGVLGSRDFTKARTLWSKAAASKQPDALFGLGLLMVMGEGGPRDEKNGVKNFRAAADMGHPRAQFAMGQAYKDGKGGLKADKKQARAWFKKALASGMQEAQTALDELDGKKTSAPQKPAPSRKPAATPAPAPAPESSGGAAGFNQGFSR